VIVADTGAILALVDADDKHHAALRELFERDPDWILPWAILPEVDYLLAAHVGVDAEMAFLRDLAEGRYLVDAGREEDFARAYELCARYRDLRLGLVDGVVAAVAERIGAPAIATLDLRHFAAIEIHGNPKLVPRDL
jgi:predicted nucleic acid-binding protein